MSGPGWQHHLYRAAMRLALWPALGWIAWRGLREPGYRRQFGERLGFVEARPSSFGGLLIHAASAGESQAAIPLIEALRRQWPDHTITLSTTTPTGADTLRRHFGDALRHVHLPLDTPGAVRRFLDRLQPGRVILLEREIWPELLHQCRQRVIPVALVNARLSERSARGHARARGLFGPIWPQLAQVIAADDEVRDRFARLGVPPERLHTAGNLKFDLPEPPAATPAPGLAGRHVVVAGSTHAAEEAALLAGWPALAQRHPGALLVLVPRHPQRFEAVAQDLLARRIAFVRHSRGEHPGPDTAVLLADTMGELPHWYAQAAVCFVGGSLAPIGGHNALEAMAAGKPVFFGPHTFNFDTLYQAVVAADAGRRVADGAALLSAIDHGLADPDGMRALGERARAFTRAHRGATDRTLQWLAPLWAGDDPAALTPVAVQTGVRSVVWHDGVLLPQGLGAAQFVPPPQADALATGSGRGQVHRLTQDGVPVLLRHYRRGGLMARLSEDRFWRERPEASRAMREYALLRLLRHWRLPVPRPVAALFTRRGPLTYQADIQVGLLPGTRNVVQRLDDAPLSAAEWQALGRAIRQLHDRQVFHADLNAHNLLLDADGQPWIVDFDKCGLRPGTAWKAQNLARLQRSLRKEAGRRQPFHWREDDWAHLQHGYGAP
ncbi:3-deoxy-D-manno-octulosonic acid kinase [Hydrogenophaga sp. NFH-34]|uniref:3-deoxy-D-manno-octulosonic acid kinase n=1 Tax=Hydrogenophaga sp. NFH-34 TaxID=2744446 RepID=UPI001F3CB9AB|nr:3-deoxy-D-manno-octulosonic acid kinase [Hydrogenophaga sp. NFH-34]